MKTSRGTETFLSGYCSNGRSLSLKWKPLGVLRLNRNHESAKGFGYRWNENLSGYWDFKSFHDFNLLFFYRWIENLSGYWDFWGQEGWCRHRLLSLNWKPLGVLRQIFLREELIPQRLSLNWKPLGVLRLSSQKDILGKNFFYRWIENLSGYWDRSSLGKHSSGFTYRWNENLSGYWDFVMCEIRTTHGAIAEMKTSRGTETQFLSHFFCNKQSIAELKTSRGTETLFANDWNSSRDYRWNENLSGYWDWLQTVLQIQYRLSLKWKPLGVLRHGTSINEDGT